LTIYSNLTINLYKILCIREPPRFRTLLINEYLLPSETSVLDTVLLTLVPLYSSRVSSANPCPISAWFLMSIKLPTHLRLILAAQILVAYNMLVENSPLYKVRLNQNKRAMSLWL